MTHMLTYDLIISLARYVGKGNSVVYATHHPKVIDELEAVRNEVYDIRRKMSELEELAFVVSSEISNPVEWKKLGFKNISDVGKRAFDVYESIRKINSERIVPRIAEKKNVKTKQGETK